MQNAETPVSQASNFDCRVYIREVYRIKNLDESSIDIILKSLSESTLKQYNSALNRWSEFCIKNKKDILDIDVKLVIRFLTEQFEAGAKYGSLNSMREALSLLCNNELSSNAELNRLFKGFFRLRPPRPKYNNTWDVDIVLSELEK